MDENPVDDFEDLPKMAIVGRPNAGKSSIVNALLICGTQHCYGHRRYYT